MSRNTISHPGLCQQAPSRWADPRQQSTTRRLCMKCPRLERCRRETLTENRTFGMWAGVWIDHDLPAKRHLLQPKSRLRAIAPHPTPDHPRRDHCPSTNCPRRRRPWSPPAASGHCEILAPACLLDQHLIFTRRTQDCPLPADSPAAALAACTNCAELIEQTDQATAQRYGYITTTAHLIDLPASAAPRIADDLRPSA